MQGTSVLSYQRGTNLMHALQQKEELEERRKDAEQEALDRQATLAMR